MTPLELLRQGGKWLGAARDWIKWHMRNGDLVTWGSDDVLDGGPWTVARVEDLAAHVASVVVEERDAALAAAQELQLKLDVVERRIAVGRQMATVIYNVGQTGDWERAKQPLIELREAWDRAGTEATPTKER